MTDMTKKLVRKHYPSSSVSDERRVIEQINQVGHALEKGLKDKPQRKK